MKIVATITCTAHAAHVGGDVERISGVIDIPNNLLPRCVKDHLRDRERAEKEPRRFLYETIAFSIMEDDALAGKEADVSTPKNVDGGSGGKKD